MNMLAFVPCQGFYLYGVSLLGPLGPLCHWQAYEFLSVCMYLHTCKPRRKCNFYDPGSKEIYEELL